MKTANKLYATKASAVSMPPVKTQTPVYWKQVLITTLAVYPLLLAAGGFLKLIFPMEALKPEVAIFFTVVVVASLMVFPVMPFIMKYVVGPWMHKRSGILNDGTNKKVKSSTIKKQNALMDTKTIRLNKSSLNIRYAELGNPANPPLLLLHGVPENLQAWYAVTPLLAKQYHVFAFDWPGFGGSEPMASPNNYTSHHFAEVVIDFMDTLQIHKAILMATDIALLPAMLVGLKYPLRVSKLAVMDGIPFPRPQYSSWELRSFAKKGFYTWESLDRMVPKDLCTNSLLQRILLGTLHSLEVRQEFSADGNE